MSDLRTGLFYGAVLALMLVGVIMRIAYAIGWDGCLP